MTFLRQYALIARRMLEALTRYLGPDQVREALQRIGLSLADSLCAEKWVRSCAVGLIAGLMRKLGYELRAIED